jgi:hypothetical protein
MASMTAVWWREGKQFVAIEANSTDADTAIRRKKSKSEGKQSPTMTLDKVTVTV